MNSTDWKMFKVFLSIFHYCVQKNICSFSIFLKNRKRFDKFTHIWGYFIYIIYMFINNGFEDLKIFDDCKQNV